MIKLITKLDAGVVFLALPSESSHGRVDLSAVPSAGSTSLGLFNTIFSVQPNAPLDVHCYVTGTNETQNIRAGFVRLPLFDRNNAPVLAPVLKDGDWISFATSLWPQMDADDFRIRALRLGQDGLMLEVAAFDSDSDTDSYRLLRLRPDLEATTGHALIWERVEDRLAIEGLGQERPIATDHHEVEALVPRALRIAEPPPRGELLFLVDHTGSGWERRRALQPVFSLSFGGNTWSPRWTLDNGKNVELTDSIQLATSTGVSEVDAGTGFSGENQGDLEFDLQFEPPEAGTGLAPRFSLEPRAGLCLTSSGMATGGAENRPYFWQFATVTRDGRPYPPAYVRYRLDAGEGPRPDPFAEQQAGLSGPLIMPLREFDTEKTWLLRLGLRHWPDAARGSRIRLVIDATTPTPTLKLTLRGGQIVAESPPLRLHCRPLQQPQHPPQEMDIRATTCTGRLEFVAATADETRRALEVDLKHDASGFVKIKGVGPDPEIVQMLLPSPMAGIDVAVWSDNWTTTEEGGSQSLPPPMRLHEGVRDAGISAGKTFDWVISGEANYGKLRLHQDSFADHGPLAGKVFPSRLPWSSLYFKDSRWRLEPRVRNPIQQRAEADAASEDQFEAPSEVPLSALEDANRALRDWRGVLTRGSFDLNDPQPLDLTGFLPGVIFRKGDSELEPKVELLPTTADRAHPALRVTSWPETSERSLDDPNARMMPGHFRWHKNKERKPVLDYAPDDGAAVHTQQLTNPPLFRHPGIQSLDAVMVGEAPCGLFVTSDNRLIKWIPTVNSVPEVVKQPAIGEETLRLVSLDSHLRGGTRVDDLAITTDQAVYWVDKVTPIVGSTTDLKIGVEPKKFELETNWAPEQQQFGRLPDDHFLLLLERKENKTRLRSLRDTDPPGGSVDQVPMQPLLKHFGYASIEKRALLVMAVDESELGSAERDTLPRSVGEGSDFFEVLLWLDVTKLKLAEEPTQSMKIGLPIPRSSLPYEGAVLGRPQVWWESLEVFWIVASLLVEGESDAPGLLAWKCRVTDDTIESEVQPIAAESLDTHFGGVPDVIAVGPRVADEEVHEPLHAVLFGPAAGDNGRDRFLRLTQPLFGVSGLATDPAAGELICRGVRAVAMVGELVEKKDWTRKFAALGGCFAFSGGDDGVLRLWDVVGGEVLHEHALNDQVLDNDSVIRPIDNGLDKARSGITDHGWSTDPVQLWMQRAEDANPSWQPCIALTRIGEAAELYDFGSGVRLWTGGLQLVPKNPADTAGPWIPLSEMKLSGDAEQAIPVLDPGEFCLDAFSKPGGNDKPGTMRLGDLLDKLSIEEISFKAIPLDRISTVEITKVLLKAILVNPGIKDSERQRADMDDADSDGIQVQVHLEPEGDEGERIKIDGAFRWRFPVAEQSATAFFLPALASRLVFIEGKAKGNAKELILELCPDKSRVQLMGRPRPLPKLPNNKVYRLLLSADEPTMIREDLSQIQDGMALSANLLLGDPGLPGGVTTTGVDSNSGAMAARLLPSLDRLVALAVEPRRLTLHNVETGALERQLDETVCCVTMMPPAPPINGVKPTLEALVSRRDGSATLLALLQHPEGGVIEAVPDDATVVRSRFHFGVEPEEIQCATVAFAGSEDRVILMRGTDGIARLWSTREGRQLDEIRLADADVTAIALSTAVPSGTLDRLLAAAGMPFSNDKLFVVAVGASDGTSRFFACRRDDVGVTRVPLRTLHDAFPVASLSLAPKTTAPDTPFFVFSCFGRGGTPLLRDLETARAITDLTGHLDPDQQFESGCLHLLTNDQFIAVLGSSSTVNGLSISFAADGTPSVTRRSEHANVVDFDSTVIMLSSKFLLLSWISDGKVKSELINANTPPASVNIDPPDSLPDARSVHIAHHTGLGATFMLTTPADRNKPGLSAHALSVDTPHTWKPKPPGDLAGSMSADWPLAAATPCNLPLSGVLAKGEDGRIRLWEPRDGSLHPLPADYGAGVLACAYLKDALCLAVAEGTRLRIINTDSGRTLRELTTELPIRHIHFVEHGDDAILLVRSDDGKDAGSVRQAYQFWTLSEYALALRGMPEVDTADNEKLIDRWLMRWAEKPQLATVSWSEPVQTEPAKIIVSLSSPSDANDSPFEAELPGMPIGVSIDSARVETTDYLLLQVQQDAKAVAFVFSSNAAALLTKQTVLGQAALDPGVLDGKPRLSWLAEDGTFRNLDLSPATLGAGDEHTIEGVDAGSLSALSEHRMVPTDTGPALLAKWPENGGKWLLFSRVGSAIKWRWVRSLPLSGRLIRRRLPAIAALGDSGGGAGIVTIWDRIRGRALGRISVPATGGEENKHWVGLLATEESLHVVRAAEVRSFALGVSSGTSEGIKVPFALTGVQSIRDAAVADPAGSGSLVLATSSNVVTVDLTAGSKETVFDGPARWVAALPGQAGATVTFVMVSDDGNLLWKKIGDFDRVAIPGDFQAVAITSAVCMGASLVLAATRDELHLYEGGDPKRSRRFRLPNTSCRIAAVDTSDGPRILVGAASAGGDDVRWHILTLQGLLRIRSGEPPVYDLGVRLGGGRSIEARATPGRRVVIRFLPPTNRPAWMPQDSVMQAFAATVGRGFYAFRLQRLDPQQGRGASGALVLWPAAASEQLGGQFLLEDRDPDRVARVSMGHDDTLVAEQPLTLSGPSLLLTAGRFNTANNLISGKTEQRFSWYLTDKSGGLLRLLFLDQAPGRCMGHIAFEDEELRCHGSLAWQVSFTADVATVGMDPKGMHLLLPEATQRRKVSPGQHDGPLVEETHDLLLPRSLSQGALSIPLIRVRPDQTEPPQIAVWETSNSIPKLRLVTSAQPIDLSNDGDLSFPLSRLGVNAPALIHASSLARALRQDAAGMSSLQTMTPAGSEPIPELEKKMYVIVPVLKHDQGLRAPMMPIAMGTPEPHLRGGYLTENLFVFSRDGDEGFPRCVSSATGRVGAGTAGSFFDIADLARQGNRLSNGSILLQRSLRDDGALSYSFFWSGDQLSANFGLSTADSTKKDPGGDLKAPVSVTDEDARWSLRQTLYRSGPSDAGTGTRRMTLGITIPGSLQQEQTGGGVAEQPLVYLNLRADSALGSASESRLTTIPTRLAKIENLPSFMPSVIELQRGSAKPGALWNLHLRGCVQTRGDHKPVVTPWMGLTLREPEPLTPPKGADVEIQSAEFISDGDRQSETLKLQWTERIGELVLPGGGPAAGEPPVTNDAAAGEDPKLGIKPAELQQRIALSQRFEESLLVLDAAAPMGFIPDKDSEGALDLYLVTTFDVLEPLEFDVSGSVQKLHAHVALISGEDPTKVVTLKLTDKVLDKVFTPTREGGPAVRGTQDSPYFVYRGSSAFWEAAKKEAKDHWDGIGRNGKLDLVWIPGETGNATTETLNKLSIFGGKGGPLRTFRPSPVLSNLALVEIYRQNENVVHERTLAFGSSAVSNGTEVRWGNSEGSPSLVIVAQGHFEQTVPLFGDDAGFLRPDIIYAYKYYAQGPIKASKPIVPVRR